MAEKTLYRVTFASQGKTYEVYARHVEHGALFGFVMIEELVFGERTKLVVDPAEEKIKTEFANVKRSFIPMHSIVRIDEVDKKGVSKVTQATGSSGNVSTFPVPLYTPGGDKSD